MNPLRSITRSIFSFALLVTGLALNPTTPLHAEGTEVHTVSRVLNADCKRLTIISPVQAIFRQGAAAGVTLTGAPEDVARVEAVVEKDRVVIRNRGLLSRGPQGTVTAVITMPELAELRVGDKANVRTESSFTGSDLVLTLDGKSTVELAAQLDGPLTTTVNGPGTLRLSGQCARHNCDATGAAQIDATAMTTSDARVRLMGEGDVRVQATKSLDAGVNGTGRVRYAGNPTAVTEHVGGGGALVKLRN